MLQQGAAHTHKQIHVEFAATQHTYIISLAALESTHAVYIEHEHEPCNRSPGALRPIWGMGPRRSAITPCMLGMLTRSANTPFVIHLCMSNHVAMHLGTSARTDMDTLDIFII